MHGWSVSSSRFCIAIDFCECATIVFVACSLCYMTSLGIKGSGAYFNTISIFMGHYTGSCWTDSNERVDVSTPVDKAADTSRSAMHPRCPAAVVSSHVNSREGGKVRTMLSPTTLIPSVCRASVANIAMQTSVPVAGAAVPRSRTTAILMLPPRLMVLSFWRATLI
jgi:hypothetical protein